jgi:two-component system, NtrC family, sensor kinase
MAGVAELLDRLLVASCEMLPDAGASKIVEVFVGIGADAFPGVGIGVRASQGSAVEVIVRHTSRSGDSATHDSERLFPSFEHERIIAIPADGGAALHLASDDRAQVFPDAPREMFLQRLAMTIGAALRHSRAHADLRARHTRLHDFDAKFVHTSRLASFGQIAADIVHELNSPLTSVLVYSLYLHQKAQRSGSDPADVERLGRLHQAAERIHGFTRDLLAYARPRHAVPTAIAIHDVIEQALVFCDYVLAELDVTVERAFGDVPAVRGIADQLTQIFVNLFTNAAHAMRQHGGRLTIQTSLVPGAPIVRVKVEDEGHGIAPEHLEKIFEPYFTTKPEGMGTGLGLSIVRSIVTAHGGHIRAYARANQGAVFEIDLPAVVRPNEPAEMPR